MNRHWLAALGIFAFVAPPIHVQAQSGAPTEQLPPKSWVDKDTGHRIWRISDEPNSGIGVLSTAAPSRIRPSHVTVRVISL